MRIAWNKGMKRPFIKCSVEDCNNDIYAHGLCSKHYARMRRNGNLLKKKRVLSEEHIRNIIKANSGRPSGMLGKHHTEESKKKISMNNKRHFLGKKLTQEHKDKLKKAHAKRIKNGWVSPLLKENPTYRTLHLWVERKLGTPKKCSHCKCETAKRYHWANIDHRYERKIENWIRLCVKCHKAFDKQQKGGHY